MFKPSILAGGSGEQSDDLEAYLFSVDQLGKTPSSKKVPKHDLVSAQRHPRLSEKMVYGEHESDACSTDSSYSVTEVEATTDDDSRIGLMKNVKMADDLLKRNELSDSNISIMEEKPCLLTVDQLEEPEASDFTANTSGTETKNRPVLTEPSDYSSHTMDSIMEEKSHFVLTVEQLEEPEPSDHTSNTIASLGGLGNIRMASDFLHGDSHTHSHVTLQTSPGAETGQEIPSLSNSEVITANALPNLDSLHDWSSHIAGHYEYMLDSFESDDALTEELSLHDSKSSTLPLHVNTRRDLLPDSTTDCQRNGGRADCVLVPSSASLPGQPSNLIKNSVDVGIQTDTAVDMGEHTCSFPWQTAVKIEGGYGSSYFDWQPLLPHIISADVLEGERKDKR